MFEATFQSATFLKRILDAIKELVGEVNLLCTEDGIDLQAMDTSHVSLINLTILPDACTTYTCTQPVTLGINLVTFYKIVRCADADDSIRLSLDSKDSAKMLIRTESLNGKKVSEFVMNLMDIDSEHLEIPGAEYNCSIKIPSTELTRLVKDLQTFGDTCSFAVKDEQLTLEVKGDLSSAAMIVKNDKTSKLVTEIECGAPTTLLLALKYISTFTKAQSLSEYVTIYMSEGIPVNLIYDMGDRGSLGYYLAPKMDE